MTMQNNKLTDGDNSIDKLKETYIHWTEAQLEKLHSHLKLLTQNNMDNPGSIIREIFELAHNIKGLGGSFGYYLMTDIADSLCEYLRNSEDFIHVEPDIISAHAKAMDVVIAEEIIGTGGAQGDQILIRLRKIVRNDTSEIAQ